MVRLVMKCYKKSKIEVQVFYKFNGKDQPERVNRVFDMLFNKVIKNLSQNEKQTNPNNS